LDEPTHETEFLTIDEIIESMILCNYIFRSGGTVSPGTKYRRKKSIIIIKTGEGGLIYNSYVPPEKRKTDMYLNCIKLDNEHFEILYRCDGYHNLDDISSILEKLFDYSSERAIERVNEVIKKAENMNLMEQVPDVMNGTIHKETKAVIYGGGLV
jgi:hypothetical protein